MCKSKRGKQSNREPGHVDFPPQVTVPRRTRIGMMVVVPALAIAEYSYNHVIAA
jgi:hypothetical protein